jgi:hypothetical protein
MEVLAIEEEEEGKKSLNIYDSQPTESWLTIVQ